MDAGVSTYRGGGQSRKLSRKEIENMKKNMKKVPVIQLKAEVYHNKEADEAEEILGNITQEETHQPSEQKTDTSSQTPWYKRLLHKIHNYFTPSK